MKVLFFLLDGDTNASSYLRVLQYLPLLRQHGIEPHLLARPVPQPLYERLVRELRVRHEREGAPSTASSS